MSFITLLRSIESAIFEIAFWVVLIPKTVYRIIKSPSSIPSYISSELQKDEKLQFTAMMSPILLWTLLVVIPGYLMNQHYNPELPLVKIGTSEQNIFLYALLILCPVLSPAIVLTAFQRREFERNTFKEFFYTQCYLQAPVMAVIIASYSLMYYGHYDFNAVDQPNYVYIFNSVNGWKDVMFFFGIVPLGWLSYAEIKVMNQLGTNPFIVWLVLIATFITAALLILTVVAITSIVFGKYIFL